MAKFTRKEIREIIGENCTDEMENRIMALHLGVVDPMKDDLAQYKAKANQLDGVQKELDDLKAKGDDGYKDKYEKEHAAFEKYKSDVTAKESRAAKEKAVRAYLESKKITGGNLEIAMMAVEGQIDNYELAGDSLKDTSSLDNLISGKLSSLIVTTTVKGANTATPPTNTGGNTFAELSLTEKMKYANEHPNDQSVKDWLNKK